MENKKQDNFKLYERAVIERVDSETVTVECFNSKGSLTKETIFMNEADALEYSDKAARVVDNRIKKQWWKFWR